LGCGKVGAAVRAILPICRDTIKIEKLNHLHCFFRKEPSEKRTVVCWRRGCRRIHSQQSMPILHILRVVCRGILVVRILSSLQAITLRILSIVPVTIVAHASL